MTKDIDFINNVNLHGYEIRDVSLYKVASVPAEATEAKKGQIVYVIGENAGFYYCDGSKWELITSETARKALADRLTTVEAQLGISEGEGTSLTSRVDTLETTLMGSDKTGTVDGVKKQTETNASNISDLQGKVNTNTTNIGTNTTAIGNINTTIGTESIGEGVTVKGAIAALQTSSASYNTKITALESKVGDTNSGLVKDVADLQATSAEYTPKVDALETTVNDPTTGLVKKVADLDSGTLKTSQLITTISGTDDTKIPSEKAVATYISTKLSGAYTFKSTVANYEALPSGASAGDIYNVTAEFTYDGKKYAAGTNVVWDADSSRWEPLTGILDTSTFQLKENIVTDTLEGGAVDKYPSVSLVKSEIAKKANAADVYTTGQVDTALGKKLDKLTTKPTAGTYAKVTINAEGQVTAGVEKITKDDIEGTLDSTQIANFASDVRTASHKELAVAITEAGALVTHNMGLAHPHVSVYDGTSLVYAAVEIVDSNSVKVYGKSTNATVTVVIS